LREAIRARCYEVVSRLDRSEPLDKQDAEAIVRKLLDEMNLPEGYVGWTMVTLYTTFWHDQVAGVPFSRRLLLLPHCLKHAEGCPADYDQFGLDCRKCGACSIADFRANAEDLGYKVLVAEGSPVVMKIIVSGYVDAIVGVACLNVLEKAFDKILLAGIPCMAVPLLSSDCRNTSVDEQWVDDMIRLERKQPEIQTRSYVHLMRAAANMFEPDEVDRLAPRLRGGPRVAELNGEGIGGLDPVAATEALGYDFLVKGGKHSRPFITMAAYDALTGAGGTGANGAAKVAAFSDSVKRTAMSIETFHKASLVHDDIEDDDRFRYGDPTMHRKYGTPTAINVGDYLIGLGYRLISRESANLGPDVAADILDRMARAHMKLSEGQGAELMWRDSLNKQLEPIDALKIYALKTSPAFEAAIYSGVRLAGPAEPYHEFIEKFARGLGVAFQILNDLGDWQGDSNNKMAAAGDTIGGRPTVLWALALAGLDDSDRAELIDIVESDDFGSHHIEQVRRLYEKANVFEQARRLVDKYQQRTEALADELEPEDLRRLMYFLIDTVLDRQPSEAKPVVDPALPIVGQ
ncbi:MAG: polyprenyl synthetase family protein, partial [Pirellulales bacterium]|nr:polyprenyl synthetase family protein [Pirellulales bacterium]